MAFDIDFLDKKDKAKGHVKKFLLYPELWRDPKNHIPFSLKWKKLKFTNSNVSKIPMEKGLYAFCVSPTYPNFINTNYLFYIGKTNRTLNIRYKEYLSDQQGKGKPRAKIYEMLTRYAKDLNFYFCEITDSNDVNIGEELLINTFLPHVNTDYPIAKLRPELKNIYE